MAIRRSCRSGAIATGCAPNVRISCSSAGWRSAAGARYQTAPSNRSARACSTPETSEPASGWPATKRRSAIASAIADLVEPTSDTTDRSSRAGERRTGGRDERADGRRDEHDVRALNGSGDVRGLLVERGKLQRAGADVGVGVPAAHVGAGARAGGEADRTPDQADAQHGDVQRPNPRGTAGRTPVQGVGRPPIRRR